MEEVEGTARRIDQLDLLNKLQRILGEGVFVASYKYALILALAELSVEKTPAADGSLPIPLEELSERFIILYWPQTAPYAGAILHQSTGQQANAVNLIARFRAEAPTLVSARRHGQWSSLVSRVGSVLVRMPLWKLQRVGPDKLDFLYEERLFDHSIVLRPGIAAFFQQQFSIVQALVQMAWLNFIQRLPSNRVLLGSTGDLAEFLFGSDRSALSSLIEGLAELQLNRCFYCERPLANYVEVDHFVPWSRYPRDLGHNFVLADRACNHGKADMLAATGHLARWVERNRSRERELQRILSSAHFVVDADASFSVTEWAYEQAAVAGALVWVRGREMCHLPSDWRRFF